jgi:acyl-[acyl-carrier-protein]-phospholipid O-acyltransferase/long-chain-fatty-acid--[acyl-carrier-protein] ligase
MIPHLRIEEVLQEIIGNGDEEEVRAVVTAVPDEKRGERLIVIHKPLAMNPDEICAGLSAAGLPNLWIPSADSFLEVQEIPVLGSGKLDLKAIADLARHRFGQSPVCGEKLKTQEA